MKKLFIILALSGLMMSNVYSQVSLTTAVDFTATDVEGNTVNLFSLLNAGKYVAIEFWATW
jgi:hypothetical protein